MTSGSNNFNDFPDNQLLNFVYLFVDPGFFLSPLNFYEASRFVPPMGWTPLTDATDKQTIKQSDKRTFLSVRLCLRWSLTLRDYIYRLYIVQQLFLCFKTAPVKHMSKAQCALYIRPYCYSKRPFIATVGPRFCFIGLSKKLSPIPNSQQIVLKPANETRFSYRILSV